MKQKFNCIRLLLAIAIGLMLSISTPVTGMQTAGQRVVWQTDLFTAYKLALAQGKMLVVLVETDWCDHCVRLNDELLTARRIDNFADRAIFLRIDADKNDDKEGQNFIKGFGIKTYPTMIFLDISTTKMAERWRVIGYHPADKYYQLMKECIYTPAEHSLRRP